MASSVMSFGVLSMRGLLVVCVCAVFLTARASFAERGVSPSTPFTGTVTILSDGLAEPGSEAQKSLVELALAIDKADSGMRVLTVLGYGGAMNARDLMQLRGADFAVLNNDVFANLDINQNGDDARRRIRLVTPLFSRGVFLFAKSQFKTPADLKGHRISVLAGRSSRIATATTIFSLLKIPVEIEEREETEFSTAGSVPDAVLLFENDLERLGRLALDPAAVKLMSIPDAPALSRVYQTKSVPRSLLGGFAPEGDLATIQVTTVLASFDWGERQARYPDAVRFVDRLFAALPDLRAKGPASAWSSLDIRAPLPGWQRFAPAQRKIAVLAPWQAADDSARLAALFAEAKPAKLGPLTVSALPRPPLSDPNAKDGGVVLQLVKEALQPSGREISIAWDTHADTSSGGTSNPAEAPSLSLFQDPPRCQSGGSNAQSPSCEGWAFSDPIMQVVVGLFAHTDSSLLTNADAADATLCVSGGGAGADGEGALAAWMKLRKPKIMNRATIIECVAAVDGQEADGFIATEAEGRFVVNKLLLGSSIAMSPVLTSIAPLRAGVSQSSPGAMALLAMLNDGMAKLRKSERFTAVMTAHMEELSGTTLVSARK